MSSRFRNDSRSGFTLLEVLISVALMSFISLGIYQLVTRTYRLREVLSNEGEFYNEIRLAMGVLDRDISMLYSPVIMLPPKPKAGDSAEGLPPPTDAADLSAIMGDQGRASDYWGGVIDKTGIRPSRFQGDGSSMSFVSTGHIRIYKEARESVMEKIAYELRPDPLAPEGLENTRALVRIVDSNVFHMEEDRDRPSRRVYPVLTGIENLTFKYLYDKDGDGDLRENSRWDTEGSDTRNRYPDAVQVELEVLGRGRLNFKGVYLFKPEIPLSDIKPST